jgi:hypothetical protein
MPSPEKLAEREFFDPSRCAGGARKAFLRYDLKAARPLRRGRWFLFSFRSESHAGAANHLSVLLMERPVL